MCVSRPKSNLSVRHPRNGRASSRHASTAHPRVPILSARPHPWALTQCAGRVRASPWRRPCDDHLPVEVCFERRKGRTKYLGQADRYVCFSGPCLEEHTSRKKVASSSPRRPPRRRLPMRQRRRRAPHSHVTPSVTLTVLHSFSSVMSYTHPQMRCYTECNKKKGCVMAITHLESVIGKDCVIGSVTERRVSLIDLLF